jgi:hypothetical protein
MTNKWIQWNGGKCPVDCNETVEVVRRIINNPVAMAACVNWQHTNSDDDVVAYRVYQTPREFELEKALAVVRGTLVSYMQTYEWDNGVNAAMALIEIDKVIR